MEHDESTVGLLVGVSSDFGTELSLRMFPRREIFRDFKKTDIVGK